jgi:hypothetical protein
VEPTFFGPTKSSQLDGEQKKLPYPIIVEGQSSTLPSIVVAADRGYSSSLDHSLWLLEGRSCRRMLVVLKY